MYIIRLIGGSFAKTMTLKSTIKNQLVILKVRGNLNDIGKKSRLVDRPPQHP